MKLTKKQQMNLFNSINELLIFITSGKRYEERNPYTFLEVKNALKVLADIQGIKDYLDVELQIQIK